MESIIDLQTLVAGLKNNTLTFSADKPVHVCFSSDMSLLDEDEDPEREGLVGIRARAYHDGVNLNGSKIECETFLEKSYTMYTRPILANVITDENGNKDFGAHDRSYSFDEEGNLVEEIIEKPIGCIESVWFEDDPAQGVTRAVVRGSLWQDYAKDAVEILKERGQVNCSVELSIKAMRFEEDTLILDDYFVMGLTLLGKDFLPGMEGSTASIDTRTFASDKQKKDEDDQQLLDIVEEEESERIAAEKQTKVTSKPESKKASKAAPKETPKEKEPEKQESESANEPDKEDKPEEDAAQTEPEAPKEDESPAPSQEEDKSGPEVSVNALVLESLSLALTTDETGQFVYLSTYSGNPASPAGEDAKQVALLDLETLTRYVRENKELLTFRAGKERAEKETIMNDPLYQPYLEKEEFKRIKDAMDSLSKEEVEAKCSLAFTRMVKEETITSPYTQMFRFTDQNVREISSSDDYINRRYGSVLKSKNKE